MNDMTVVCPTMFTIPAMPETEMSLDTAIAAVRDMALAGPDGTETADKVIAFMERLHAEAMS